MKLNLYGIKDTVIGAISTPFAQNNNATAIRMIRNYINSPTDNEIKQNYKDKQLYLLGEYDDNTGYITSNVEFVVNLSDLKEEV